MKKERGKRTREALSIFLTPWTFTLTCFRRCIKSSIFSCFSCVTSERSCKISTCHLLPILKISWVTSLTRRRIVSCSFSSFVVCRESAFTKANSTRDEKTKNMQVNSHTSIAFGYETRGVAAYNITTASDVIHLAIVVQWRKIEITFDPDIWVAMVSTVVTPSEIRAGIASMLIQNEIQERITMRMVGTYVWSMKKPYCRSRWKLMVKHGYSPWNVNRMLTRMSLNRQILHVPYQLQLVTPVCLYFFTQRSSRSTRESLNWGSSSWSFRSIASLETHLNVRSCVL